MIFVTEIGMNRLPLKTKDKFATPQTIHSYVDNDHDGGGKQLKECMFYQCNEYILSEYDLNDSLIKNCSIQKNSTDPIDCQYE